MALNKKRLARLKSKVDSVSEEARLLDWAVDCDLGGDVRFVPRAVRLVADCELLRFEIRDAIEEADRFLERSENATRNLFLIKSLGRLYDWLTIVLDIGGQYYPYLSKLGEYDHE